MDGSGVSPAFAALQRGWQAGLGGFPLPAFSPATMADFRVTSRATRVDDVAVTDLHGASVIRTEGPPADQRTSSGSTSSNETPGR
jgi:AraC family transcriptional regulator, positive regulator of tynA and feaB